ncbi:MAG: VOC family protein [Ilumatobacteraceae bacterium]
MAKRVQITFDATDPHALAAWWAARLEMEVEDNSPLVQQLLDAGIITDADTLRVGDRLYFADAVAAADPDGQAPRMLFQRVPEGKIAKNRVHLDVPAPAETLDDEVAAWVATGASLQHFASHPGHRWAVMHDPEGNEFCLH